MFPLLEMSSERSKFVKDILYIWNDLNEMNEHKTKRDLQIKSELYIRNMKKYNRIEDILSQLKKTSSTLLQAQVDFLGKHWLKKL